MCHFYWGAMGPMRWIVLCIISMFWMSGVHSIEEGDLHKTQLRSRALRNSHDIWIYTPPGYQEHSQAYPLLIVFDGQAYTSNEWVPTPKILDELIGAGEIRPIVAVFVSSGDQKRRNKELPCHEPFARFVVKDLLPYVRQNYRVTSDPKEIVIAGSSYGGLAAAYVALLHSDQIGNVLSQSGAFYWTQPRCDRNPSYLIRQYRRETAVPVKFYLEVGDKETEGRNSILAVNREMRDVLKQKGYDVVYREFEGGHEYKCWRKALPDGLKAFFAS